MFLYLVSLDTEVYLRLEERRRGYCPTYSTLGRTLRSNMRSLMMMSTGTTRRSLLITTGTTMRSLLRTLGTNLPFPLYRDSF